MEKSPLVDEGGSGAAVSPSSRFASGKKSWRVVSVLVALVLGTTIWRWTLSRERKVPGWQLDRVGKAKWKTHGEVVAPRENVWMQLSEGEVEGVRGFLDDGAGIGLGLRSWVGSSVAGNTIYHIQTLRPNKTDVLPYLEDGEARLPMKWAHVVVEQGQHPNATIDQYMVGPVPITSDTKLLPLAFLHTSGKHSIRKLLPDPEVLLAGIKASCLPEMLTVLREVYHPDVTFESNITNLYDVRLSGQAAYAENGRIVLWGGVIGAGKYAEAWSLLPQGIFFKFDLSDAEAEKWFITNVHYNGQLFDGIDALMQATKQEGFEKVQLNLDGDWTMLEDFGPGERGREHPPPVMIQDTPSRYAIDRKQNFVSWMGFTFYYAFSQVTGITLFDIRFKGETIIYELGLQEALSHYAGDNPIQGNLAFMDTFFGMGSRMFSLVPGYDCPTYATFLDTVYYPNGVQKIEKNSICTFEYTSDSALQRHTTDTYTSVSQNTYFVLRSVSTVGNYDYTISYHFYLDGSIEVKLQASGYIYSTYHSSSGNSSYGYRVHDADASSIHTHVLNFKADLDLAGSSNSLTRVDLVPLTTSHPWDGHPRHTMHLEPFPIRTESGFNWPANSASSYIFTTNQTNEWGIKRGYAMKSGTGMGNPVHLIMANSSTVGKTATWAMQDFWVLKRKDVEAKSVSEFNILDVENPLIDFASFVNGEGIEDEDLVVYFNLGGHHVPTSGDIPNTLMHTSASSVMFVPHNWGTRDASRQSSTGVRVDHGNRNNTRYYGGRRASAGVEPDGDGSKGSAKEGSTDRRAWYKAW